MSPRFPVRTLLLCGAAVAVHFLGEWQASLVFDRAAIAAGEWWRIATGNLAHYSPSHLLFNVLALAVAGTLIETRRLPHLGVLFLAGSVAIGLTIWFAEPGLRYYAGLSGLATAAVVYLCLHGLGDRGSWRWLCIAVLAGVAAKLGAELLFGFSLFAAAEPPPFTPVPLSHAAGAATALLLFGLATMFRHVGDAASSP